MVLGFDIDAQRDDRKRYANNQGEQGEKTTDQDEHVTSYGMYFQDALEVTTDVTMTLGVRYDRVNYDVDDNTSGDGSGNTDFDEISPLFGLVWSPGPAVNLYGNIAGSFDPPTTTELANPRGTSGFNTGLKPQTATNYEIGIKGLLSGRVRYELALFRVDVDDELVSYELSGSGQSFFENAASSKHEGLESSLTLRLLPGLTSRMAYTYSDFTFDRFRDRSGNDYDGNKIPGVPDNQFHLALNYEHPAGFFASGDVLHAGGFYADNANTVKSGAFTVVNLRAGLAWRVGRWEVSPFLGVNNVFAQEYFDNIRLNAGFGRYYEPAPERNIYGGVGVRFRL
jgi:iron complex outermembrane receptor protein